MSDITDMPATIRDLLAVATEQALQLHQLREIVWLYVDPLNVDPKHAAAVEECARGR